MTSADMGVCEMVKRIVPVREPCPSLPEASNSRPTPANFGKYELFGFDTETTRCGKKELRSIQFSYYDERTKPELNNLVYSLKGWFDKTSDSRIPKLAKEKCLTTHIEFDTLAELRKTAQGMYEHLVFEGEPRVKRNRNDKMRINRRKVKRCAVAFNGNFDLGVIADTTTLSSEMMVGGMEGAGCIYDFTSGAVKTPDAEYGMKIKVLFLGAFNVPYTPKRGEIWDIQSLTRTIWGAANLQSVGVKVGLKKLVDEGERSFAYAVMDSIITLKAAIQVTADLEEMGFTGNPDRFISGATVAKDMMKQYYTPFYLTQKQHEFVWPAYFGGMTGCLDIDVLREPVNDVIYGDLDGAYNASGQKLKVFQWSEVSWVTKSEIEDILKIIEKDPSRYWEFGSLHIKVKGDFDNVPVRVGTCGEGGTPSQSEGLVWARMRNYATTLSVGDYLHSRPLKHEIIEGLMATGFESGSPCLFKKCDDERKKYPKYIDGVKQPKNFVPNTWFKLAGNTLYGSMANRNGKKREVAGKWFNAIMCSSITGAIRHAMWTVNEASGAYYNDTDSALTTVEGFHNAVEALKPLGIGFSNKTNDELENCDVASMGIIQGSKRYALVAKDGTFGANCHGLGSWFVNVEGSGSVAHNEDILEAVWRFNYPDTFGLPNQELLRKPVFHKFSIKTLKVANMVQEYARRQWDIPVSELASYGKAGNFGYLSPTIVGKKIVVKVSYDPDEAERISDLTLGEIAFGWGQAYDKKFNYSTGERWLFEGGQIVDVKAVANSQDINAANDDISIHVNHDANGV